ncbi:MAG: TRAP transporter large permease subunit, partial [Fidelibacterota bacterium]
MAARSFRPFVGKTVSRWEDLLALSALLAMATLPFIEAVTRLFRLPGVPGSAMIVQHLTLWIGFLGAILAARQNKLLALTRTVPSGGSEPQGLKHWFSRTVALTVTVMLAVASFQLVRIEAASPTDVLPGVPVWALQVIMPLGFLLIGVEILKQSGKNPVLRAVMIAAVVVIGAIGLGESLRVPLILWLGITGLGVSLVFGAPIFVGLGGIAVLMFWYDAGPISAIPAEMYRIVVSPTLPTIPLFTLAGYVLAEGGASRRLMEVFRTWFGWIPGGTPVAVTFLCGFFTAITGGSGVTILALGGLLLPMLLREGYSRKFSIGLITVSGSLGLLFPPSLPAIIYGVTAGVAINKLFLAGIIPGILLVVLVASL